MLAVTGRREVFASHGSLSQEPSSPAFRAAYRELCTRLWIELELLAQATQRFEGPHPHNLTMRAAILRLELIVLVDSCRSSHWRRLLSEAQSDRVCSMSTDLLAALYVDSEHLSTGIANAQERILDELMPQSEPGRSPGLNLECELDLEPEFEPNSAVHELISLLEAQAAARATRRPNS
jgi:hypothetical protein